MKLNVVRMYGYRKLHLATSMISFKTVCGKESVSMEMISMYDYPFNLCEKCWAFIGKQMADEYFGKKRWDELVEYFDKHKEEVNSLP